MYIMYIYLFEIVFVWGICCCFKILFFSNYGVILCVCVCLLLYMNMFSLLFFLCYILLNGLLIKDLYYMFVYVNSVFLISVFN